MVCMLEAVTVKEEVLKQNEVSTDRMNRGGSLIFSCKKPLERKTKVMSRMELLIHYPT